MDTIVLDIQTLTIIIACVALALALEASVLIVWHSKKMSQQMNSLHDEVLNAKNDSRLQLIEPQTALPDFTEQSFDESKIEINDSNLVHDPLLEQAYNIFYLHYRQLARDTTVDNLEKNSQEFASLLLEMGYWLKDYLPVWHKDFNATSVQKNNVESIMIDDEKWRQTQTQAPLPTNNPYKTPFEVIALVQKLREWGVEHFRFLISGFRYQNQNS